MIRMTLDEVRELAVRILRRHAFSEAHVQAVADTLVAGERDECASHGIWRLLGCIATLKAGKVSADAEPELHDIAPGLLRVDAHGGFSQCAFRLGLPHLLEKARSQGIAAMAVNRCVHFSALWVEVRKPIFGTNPIAFGWPRPDGPPFVFDFATSAVARGEIQLHERAGKPIPLGWGVDEQGEPTTDASAALRGAMLTFGGHKGSALAAMVELLAGPLIGDLTSAESLAYDEGSRSSPYGGELLIAIDPRRMLGASAEEHLARAETLFEGIVEQGARLPSQRRFEARERSARDGVTIPEALHRELLALLE
ncbi:Ldh family oxidoreductase [Pseudomonas aeruginosa]|uniref:Ldh family oxidoreductase n=1 Tax=Pseudomonas aeruginosa TaxID=287 RepID=UPI00071B01D9|nr:Ldh family oxidoreductase [Pseudomonas aeruginosa]KSC16485.1 oxidoreductase [Pseudomonas aeruginosa]